MIKWPDVMLAVAALPIAVAFETIAQRAAEKSLSFESLALAIGLMLFLVFTYLYFAALVSLIARTVSSSMSRLLLTTGVLGSVALFGSVFTGAYYPDKPEAMGVAMTLCLLTMLLMLLLYRPYVSASLRRKEDNHSVALIVFTCMAYALTLFVDFSVVSCQMWACG